MTKDRKWTTADVAALKVQNMGPTLAISVKDRAHAERQMATFWEPLGITAIVEPPMSLREQQMCEDLDSDMGQFFVARSGWQIRLPEEIALRWEKAREALVAMPASAKTIERSNAFRIAVLRTGELPEY